MKRSTSRHNRTSPARALTQQRQVENGSAANGVARGDRSGARGHKGNATLEFAPQLPVCGEPCERRVAAISERGRLENRPAEMQIIFKEAVSILSPPPFGFKRGKKKSVAIAKKRFDRTLCAH